MSQSHIRVPLVVGVLALAFALPGKLPAGEKPASTQPAPRRAPAAAAGSRPAPLTLADCRRQYGKGGYAGAAEGYRKLLARPAVRLKAAVGLARALGMQGKYSEAIAALESAAAAGAKDADWQVAMADSLATVGEYDKALTHAARACKLRDDWAPAILIHGQLLETLGRKKQAARAYAAKDRVLAGEAYLKDARSLVALGRILDRHGALSGKRVSDQATNIYNNYLQQAYLEVDEKYWPACVAAGMFLLEKHRPKTAALEFKLAGKINPRIPAVHVGLGVIDLGEWKFEQCLRRADAALKINPRYVDGFVHKAICHMRWRKFDQVAPALKKALAVNPNHVEALSLMAAMYERTFRTAKAQPFIRRVAKINPVAAELHTTIGHWLASGRQYEAAVKHYLRAAELAPEQAEPLAGLGQAYMQTGEEDKARPYLEKAHEIDDFRADVINYIRLLDRMDKFEVRETEHFILKVDPTRDAVLLGPMAEYMEEIYAQVCEDYGFHPTQKTIIEVFPTQKQFSIRLSGRGWVPTVGACTGRVIVLTAPDRDVRTPLGPHNWAAVLRHEFTHTVTLLGTKNRIPHWFTEACAVWQQPDKRSYENIQVLVRAVRGNRLLPIKELNWGFIRPKRPGDRHLAYAQSEWIQEFIITTTGYDTIPKMLKGFRDGLSQAEVFEKIVGIKESDFDRKFRAWAVEQVRSWKFRPDPPPSMSQAQAEATAKPEDAAAQARLAVACYVRGKMPPAEKAARKALDLDPKNVRALAVLARALQARKETEEAIAVAKRLEAVDHDSVTAPRVLAEVHLAKREFAKAIPALELLKQRLPLEGFAYTQLAALYTRLGMSEKALPNLVHLHRHTTMTPKYARQAAEIYRTLGQDEMALKYYREVLYVDPYDAGVYDAIAGLHRKARRYDRAAAAIEQLTLLRPKEAASWNKLAVIRYRAWRAAPDKNKDLLFSARAAAQKALALEPDGQGIRILERIDEAIGQSKP